MRRGWRRLRDWTEAGVRPRLHEGLLAELRRAGLLGMDVTSTGASHVRALKDISGGYGVKLPARSDVAFDGVQGHAQAAGAVEQADALAEEVVDFVPALAGGLLTYSAGAG